MKTKFASAALAVLMLTSIVNADTGEQPRKGPLITYMDCVTHCVDTYGKWTLRRTACAADCYLGIFGSVVSVMADIK